MADLKKIEAYLPCPFPLPQKRKTSPCLSVSPSPEFPLFSPHLLFLFTKFYKQI